MEVVVRTMKKMHHNEIKREIYRVLRINREGLARISGEPFLSCQDITILNAMPLPFSPLGDINVVDWWGWKCYGALPMEV